MASRGPEYSGGVSRGYVFVVAHFREGGPLGDDFNETVRSLGGGGIEELRFEGTTVYVSRGGVCCLLECCPR